MTCPSRLRLVVSNCVFVANPCGFQLFCCRDVVEQLLDALHRVEQLARVQNSSMLPLTAERATDFNMALGALLDPLLQCVDSVAQVRSLHSTSQSLQMYYFIESIVFWSNSHWT
jgi:hypothetical protein